MPRTATPLDTTETADRLRRSMMRLARILRQEDDDDLTPSLASVLFVLDRHGPLSLGALAKHEHLTKPSVTAIVDKLLRLGLIERTIDAQDRRVAYVSLTAGGRRHVIARRKRRTAWLAARMDELPQDDVRTLSDAADVFEALILRAGEESHA